MKHAVFLLIALAPLSALAHDADIIYAQVERTSGSSEVKELVTMTASTLTLLAPVDRDRDGVIDDAELAAGSEAIGAGVWSSLPMKAGGVDCALQRHDARFKETYLELRAVFRCPQEGELVQTFRVLSILPRNYKVVLGTFVNGEAGARFAQDNEQTLILDAPKQSQVSGLWGWIKLGVEHIWEGRDHLCFVFALLLAATSLRRVLLMVTSFTVAHSITLGLTAANVISLSPSNVRWIEALIALSIIWVAVENVVRHQEQPHRYVLTFAFGLIHGFGFATSLRGYGVERELATALFGFNLGVELGQAAVVLAALPVIFFLRRKREKIFPLAMKAASLVIAAAGGYWLVERVVG